MMLLACILAWPIACGGVLVGTAWALSMWQRRHDVRRMHQQRKQSEWCGHIQPTRPWPRK